MTVGAFKDRASRNKIRWRRWDDGGQVVALSEETFPDQETALEAARKLFPSDKVDDQLAWPG